MPKLVNQFGVKYLIEGDVGSEECKLLMREAFADLTHLKETNVLELDHLRLEKPGKYIVNSQFGEDTVYINIPAKRGEREIELPAAEIAKQEIESGLYPAFEAFNIAGDKIGYVICLSGTFNSGYYFLKTNNVVGAKTSKENLATIRANNPGITVDPFFFPAWKYWYVSGSGYYFGDSAYRPFDEPLLTNKLIAVESKESDLETYIDIACTFEQMIVIDEGWHDPVVTHVPGWGEVGEYWLPYYSGDITGEFEGENVWRCLCGWGVVAHYDGYNSWIEPDRFLYVTKDGWTEEGEDYSELMSIDGTSYCSSSEVEDYYGNRYMITDVPYCYHEVYPRTDGSCKFGWFNDDEVYWAYGFPGSATRIAVPYGGWCSWQGCWNQMYEDYAVPWFNTYKTIEFLAGSDLYQIDDPSGWEYVWVNTQTGEGYFQDVHWSNANDNAHYAGCFMFNRAISSVTSEKVETIDPREVYYEQRLTGEVYPQGIVLDNVYDYGPYYYSLYIEVNGAKGVNKKIIYEETRDTSITSSYTYCYHCQVRYYQLSEDFYIVLASLWLKNSEWENDQYLYVTYRSDSGFLEDATFQDLRLYGMAASPHSLFYFHQIQEGLNDEEGNPILADGSFRLIQIIKEYDKVTEEVGSKLKVKEII